LIFAVSWGAIGFATSHRIQPLSILIGILGVGQLFLLYRATREGLVKMEPALLAD
jgi:hypothetical protein